MAEFGKTFNVGKDFADPREGSAPRAGARAGAGAWTGRSGARAPRAAPRPGRCAVHFLAPEKKSSLRRQRCGCLLAAKSGNGEEGVFYDFFGKDICAVEEQERRARMNGVSEAPTRPAGRGRPTGSRSPARRCRTSRSCAA